MCSDCFNDCVFVNRRARSSSCRPLTRRPSTRWERSASRRKAGDRTCVSGLDQRLCFRKLAGFSYTPGGDHLLLCVPSISIRIWALADHAIFRAVTKDHFIYEPTGR